MTELLLSKISNKSTSIRNKGSYPVVISLVAFMGTNSTEKYKNLTQVVLGFTANNMESIYKIYTTNCVSPSSVLYQDLNGICGDLSFLDEYFDMFSILGKQVLIDVIIKNDGKKLYPVINTISPLTNFFDASGIDLVKFSFDYIDQMHKMPDWICNCIKSSKEWKDIK